MHFPDQAYHGHIFSRNPLHMKLLVTFNNTHVLLVHDRFTGLTADSNFKIYRIPGRNLMKASASVHEREYISVNNKADFKRAAQNILDEALGPVAKPFDVQVNRVATDIYGLLTPEQETVLAHVTVTSSRTAPPRSMPFDTGDVRYGKNLSRVDALALTQLRSSACWVEIKGLMSGLSKRRKGNPFLLEKRSLAFNVNTDQSPFFGAKSPVYTGTVFALEMLANTPALKSVLGPDRAPLITKKDLDEVVADRRIQYKDIIDAYAQKVSISRSISARRAVSQLG